MNDDTWALETFTGTARLFPLPNLVLFPHVVQPLHVFEPRYRQMTADALAGDRLIAMALPRKQQLLEEPDVGARARLLLESLLSFLPPIPNSPEEPRKFPPDFSLN